MYIDGTKIVAGGGQGTSAGVCSTSHVSSVVLYNGNNVGSVASRSIHWHGDNTNHTRVYPNKTHDNPNNSCYTVSHEHGFGGCEEHEKYEISAPHSGGSQGDCPICGRGLVGYWQENGEWAEEGDTIWGCGGGPCNDSLNTWTLSCGKEHGQIIGLPSSTVAASTNPYNWSAAQSNTGAGKFSIQLVEQNRLSVSGPNNGLPAVKTTVQQPVYLNSKVKLLVMQHSSGEKYAAYVKHGN